MQVPVDDLIAKPVTLKRKHEEDTEAEHGALVNASEPHVVIVPLETLNPVNRKPEGRLSVKFPSRISSPPFALYTTLMVMLKT